MKLAKILVLFLSNGNHDKGGTLVNVQRIFLHKITSFQMSRHCLNGQLLVYVPNGRLDHVSDCISSTIVTG